MNVLSGQANQLLSRIDSSLKAEASVAGQLQGVTKGDLAKLDQDQDGQISETEAPELNPQELTLFNKALNDGRAATEVVFVREPKAAKPPAEVSVPTSLAPPTVPSSIASRTVSQLVAQQQGQQGPQHPQQPQVVAPSTLAPIYRPVSEPVIQPVDPPQGTVKGVAAGTGYYPANTRLEGGFVDKADKPLQTLQDYLDGKADYVSIALDKHLYESGQIKYGDSFRIPELEEKYGRKIIFKAVDTGGAFTHKGFGRVDICTRSEQDSLDATINGKLTLIKTD